MIAPRAAVADGGEGGRWPRRQLGLHLGGGASYLGHESVGGPVVVGEYGVGRGRWQWIANGEVMWMLGDHGGAGGRVGPGARWLARSFQPDHSASIDLFLHGGVGVQHLALAGGQVTRPDVWFGWGMQVRNLEGGWSIRLGFRVELAPAFEGDAVARVLCRGACPSTPSASPIDDGFKTMLGVAW